MKTKRQILLTTVLFLASALCSSLFAQDTIQKVDGEVIYGKVIEVGTKSVSYKKTGAEDGPSYAIELKMIANIKYKNGTKEEYKKSKLVSTTTSATSNSPKTAPSSVPSEQKLPSVFGTETTTASTSSTTTDKDQSTTKKADDNNPLKNGPVSNQYRIDHLDKKYLINNQKVSSKAVDKLLAKSTNPAVVAMAKTAKITKTFQKITKLTSYPSTIAGGIASIATFSNVYNQIQKGGASTQSYVNAGLSFLGTLTLPITSKILKSRRDKLYDKAIDLYNISN